MTLPIKLAIPEYSPEALTALALAADSKVSVDDLELLGIETRVIKSLEQAGISTMDLLLKTSTKRLLRISRIGVKTVQNILNALTVYHTLPDIAAKKLSDVSIRVEDERLKSMSRIIGQDHSSAAVRPTLQHQLEDSSQTLF